MFGKRKRTRRSRSDLKAAVNKSDSEPMELRHEEVGDALDLLTEKIKLEANKSTRKVKIALDELEAIEIPQAKAAQG